MGNYSTARLYVYMSVRMYRSNACLAAELAQILANMPSEQLTVVQGECC